LVVFQYAAIALAVLVMTGQAICCQVPGGGAARGLAIGSVVASIMAVVSLLVILLVTVFELRQQVRGGAANQEVVVRVFLWLSIGLAAAGLILHLFFLECVARSFQRWALSITVFIQIGATMLFLIYLVVLHILKGPQVLALFSANIMNTAGVGRAVDITFFAGLGVILVWLFISSSLVGSAIRRTGSFKAARGFQSPER
jgi:hypothetical protein